MTKSRVRQESEEREDHDQLLKELLRAFLDDFVKIVAPEIAPNLLLEKPEFLDKETFTDLPKGKHRYMDLVAKVPAKEGPPELILVHTEIEGKASAEIGKRMWRYYMQLKLRHDLPVLPVVLFLEGGNPEARWNLYEERFLEREISRYSYLSFGLSGAPAENYVNRPELLGAGLAALMKPGAWGRPKLKLECMRRIARATLNEAKRFLLLNCVQTYLVLEEAERRDYDKLLEGEPNEVKRMETWADKMLAKGRAEGEAKGKAEALLLILKQRGLRVTKLQREKILACTELLTLEEWLSRSLTVTSTTALFTSQRSPRRKSPRAH